MNSSKISKAKKYENTKDRETRTTAIANSIYLTLKNYNLSSRATFDVLAKTKKLVKDATAEFDSAYLESSEPFNSCD